MIPHVGKLLRTPARDALDRDIDAEADRHLWGLSARTLHDANGDS
jgi:hypothetical protein